MSSSGSGRNDPQPSSTTGSKSTDASSEEQDLGKENHEQKIKRWLHKINPVERLSRRDSRTRKSDRQDDQPSERRSRERERPSRRQESNSGLSNFGNRIKRTFSFTGSGNDGAKAEPSPDPVEISTRSTRTPKAKPKSSESGHSKPKRKSKVETPEPANDMAPTTFEPVNAPLRPANPAMSREVIRREEKPDEKEPASTRTQFEVVNAAVRPAECHGPLNPKKKLVKPTKEPKEDASEREQRTDAVAVREKPGASVTQYKIVYSASKGKQIPRYIPDPAPTNPNNNTTAPPIIANPPSPAQAPPSPEPLKATASPTNEQQAKVEDKDTPTSCYMFYQR